MLTCKQCQAQLLDRLYGLLDTTDAAALDAHLAGCPACQAERAKAERLQRLLAAAARTEFPDLRFEPPGSEVTPLPAVERPTAGVPAKRGWAPRWYAWGALAAALLLAVGIPAGSHVNTVLRQQRQVADARRRWEELDRKHRELRADHQRRLAEATTALRQASEQAQAAQAQLGLKLHEAVSELQAKQLSLVITGPATPQAGAPNEYHIEARDGRNQPAPATLSYRVKDRDNKVVTEQDKLKGAGSWDLRLPADLPLKPGSDLVLEVTAQGEAGPRAELREQLHLSGPVYVTHLTTDKPLYQPGETVYFRSLTLDRNTLKPAAEELHLQFVIKNPLQTETVIATGASRIAGVSAPDGGPVQGIGTGEWAIPPDAPGGEYALLAREANGRFPEERRKFLVNRYQPARLNKELEWSRKSYGPGDEVIANCKVTRAEGGPVARQPVTAEAFVDGQRVPVDPPANTGPDGTVAVKLRLPKPIERGEASLAVRFTDGGAQETLVKPIPVALNKLLIDFYPEGGELVAGVPNRVYFQARTTLGKPADLHARVVDETGREVARAETLSDDKEAGINQGMGRFEFTPEFGQKYRLAIDRPANIEGEHKLPDVKAEGVVLTTFAGVSADPDPLRVRVSSPGVARTLLVGAYARGRLLDHRRLAVAANGSADVDLKPETGIGGVTRVTVFEEQPGEGPHRPLKPVAERLVYRKPAAALKLVAKPDKDRYVPGDAVKLRLSALNEKSEPTPAVAVVGVVNQSVVTMADEKTARSLPTHFLLTSEVQRPEDLEHADVLLGDHPKAAAALDLLLGTQGWRRFAEQHAPDLLKQRDQDAERILLAIGQSPRANLQTNSYALEQQKVLSDLQPGVAQAQQRLDDATQTLTALQSDTHFPEEVQKLAGEVAAARSELQTAQATLAATEDARRRLLNELLPVVCGLFLAWTLVALMLGLWRGLRYYVAAAASLGLAGAAALLLALHVGGVGDHGAATEVVQGAAPTTATRAAEVRGEKAEVAPGKDPAAEVELLKDHAEPANRPAGGPDEMEMRGLGRGMNGVARPAPPGEGGAAGFVPADGVKLGERGERAAGKRDAGGAAFPDMPQRGQQPGAPRGEDKLAAPTAPAAPLPRAASKPAPEAPRVRGREEDLYKRNDPKDMKSQPARLGAEPQQAGEKAVPLDLERRKAMAPAREPAQHAAEGLGRQLQQARPNAEGDDRAKKEAEVRRAGVVGGRPMGGGRGGPGFGGVPGGGPAGPMPAAGAPGFPGGAAGAGLPVPGLMPPAGGINGGIGGGFGGGGFGGFPGGPRGGFGGEGRLALGAFPRPAPQPFVVREYAHRHSLGNAGDRTDFAETVYWHPVLVLPKDGAEVSFDLSDAVTRYRVLAAAHTADGRLGALTAHVEARKPLSLEPKLPVEITAGDKVDVPVTLANDTDAALPVTVEARPHNLTLSRGSLEDKLTLAPQQRTRRVFRFQPTVPEGTAELTFVGRTAQTAGDSVVATLPVVSEGFPVVGSVSDVLERVARHEIVLPRTWVPGTLKCEVNVYPSTLAELQKGLEALLREPGGCFEQTSTTNYPNTLILQYLRESDQGDPDAVRRARGLLERGYAKLTAFEVPQDQRREGFEWFGQAPAHEALTAYGLMQFRDMATVQDVDPALLKRTRDFLLARRDGKGGFQRNPRALDTFGRAPDEVTNAYIVWALTEGSKEDDITKEMNVLASQAKTSKDPYFLALVANGLLNRDRTDEALAILRTLAGMLTKDGYLDGARTSITGSSGRMLQIETTALAVLGWLKANRPEFTAATRAAVGWIGKQRGGFGGFGSTQSTILALKALIAYTKANKRTAEDGELSLYVGDRLLNKLAFAAGMHDALTLTVPDADRQLKPGKNDVRIEITGKNTFPYSLAWSYRTVLPPSAAGCAVRLTTALDRPELTEGETARLKVKLENVSGQGQGMAVAVIGLPAGLKLPDDFAQLKDLARLRDNGTKPGVIGAFEVRGRELVLYWRDLAPDAKVELSLDLRGHVPGEYRGPASRAYLYYNPDVKHWTAPLAVTVRAGT